MPGLTGDDMIGVAQALGDQPSKVAVMDPVDHTAALFAGIDQTGES